MANTRTFKNTAGNAHRVRYMTTEDSFVAGMRYINTPLTEGSAKTIVNFNLKNNGEILTPRGGLRTVSPEVFEKQFEQYNAGLMHYGVHHANSMYISNADETDAILYPYLLTGFWNKLYGGYTNLELSVEMDTTNFIKATYDDSAEDAVKNFVLRSSYNIDEIQGMRCVHPTGHAGVYASLEGNTYVLVMSSAQESCLGRIVAKFNEDRTAITWYIKKVTPTEIQPTQALNYGYNMFKDNPYSFENKVSATGAIELTGVIPYDDTGKLLLSARPGTPITFKLCYKYPQTDVDSGDKYLIQWEAQNLESSAEPTVIRKVRNSTEYTPGSDITFRLTPPFKAFSLIVRVYKKSEIDIQDAAWEADTALQALVTKDDYLTPNQVTTLASYYLTNDTNNTLLNAEAVKYDLCTASGMCTWQQRIVLWGVNKAPNTLFVSEINTPGYMPYPNNSEIFKDRIVCAVPYMSDLLVFTKTALYKLVLNADGLTYTTTCVQEKLNMTVNDACTVVTVQNMVYFKSGNYYYMVVPNITSLNGGLQLAPVSRPIERMLDDLKGTLSGLLNDVYNMHYDEYENKIGLELLDFHVYLDDTQVRNVYKVLVTIYEGASTEASEYVIDISLNYDTVLRAWTVYMWESTRCRMEIYKPTVTGNTVYAHNYQVGKTFYTDLVQLQKEVVADNATLDNHKARKYGNYQLLETGYRDFNEDLKKRFREVQFCVNISNAEQLKFHTAFTVDDTDVVPLYKHNVSQCVDKNDVNYGVIFVERELRPPYSTPSTTALDTWELDTSVFPDITVHKVRYHVSGKGYGGSVKILSLNEVPYELLHINWVYRVMFAR